MKTNLLKFFSERECTKETFFYVWFEKNYKFQINKIKSECQIWSVYKQFYIKTSKKHFEDFHRHLYIF